MKYICHIGNYRHKEQVLYGITDCFQEEIISSLISGAIMA